MAALGVSGDEPLAVPTAEDHHGQQELYAPGPDDDSASARLLRDPEETFLVEDMELGDETVSKDTRERWNYPKVNAFRYISVNLSFFIMGMHDGCIGVSLEMKFHTSILRNV